MDREAVLLDQLVRPCRHPIREDTLSALLEFLAGLGGRDLGQQRMQMGGGGPSAPRYPMYLVRLFRRCIGFNLARRTGSVLLAMSASLTSRAGPKLTTRSS